MADNLTAFGAFIGPRCYFCGHSVANPGDMCGMCAGSKAAQQRRVMADNLTDAQKAIATALLERLPKHLTAGGNVCTNELAVAVDEALGGLTREYASGQIVPGEAEYTITDGSRGPGRKNAEKCLYFPRFDLIARWVSGWTPEETQ